MVKKVIIVSAHVLYFSFTPIYVRQVRLSGTPVYINLSRFTLVGRDVELDNFCLHLHVNLKTHQVLSIM